MHDNYKYNNLDENRNKDSLDNLLKNISDHSTKK